MYISMRFYIETITITFIDQTSILPFIAMHTYEHFPFTKNLNSAVI